MTGRHAAMILAVIAFAAVAYEFAPNAIGCGIKGNISKQTGERIYHVEGQKYYRSTVINPFQGERWFCSEEEARAAGWRRSRV
jgi:hypothetical protein